MASERPSKKSRSRWCWTSFDQRPKGPDYMDEEADIESCMSSDEIAGIRLPSKRSASPAPASKTRRLPRQQEATWEVQSLFAGSQDQTSAKGKNRASRGSGPGTSSGSTTGAIPAESINAPAPKQSLELHPADTKKQERALKPTSRNISSESSRKRPISSNRLVFDDDDAEKVEVDEDLDWNSKRLDWDGFFLPRSTPQESYPFEGTATQTLINLAKNIPEPLRRARRRLAEVITSTATLMPQTIPLDLLQSAPEEIKRLIEKAREEGRQVPDRVRDWAEAAARMAREVANAVPPLDLQMAATGARPRR